MQNVTDESVFLNSGPLFHVATLITTTPLFHHGGTNVFTAGRTAEDVCRLVEAHRCTHAFLMRPTIEQITTRTAAVRPVQPLDRHRIPTVPQRHDLPGREPVVRAARRLRPDRGGRLDDARGWGALPVGAPGGPDPAVPGPHRRPRGGDDVAPERWASWWSAARP